MKAILDERRDPKAETERFQAAQEAKDYTTMFDVLFHSSCQYCKKRGQGKYWDSDKLYDVATDMTLYLMQRYQRNPDYKMTSHICQVHFAFLRCVYGDLYKRDKEKKQTCSYDVLDKAIPAPPTDYLEP